MSRPAWHAEARRLRGEGYSYDAIAILLGVASKQTVWAAVNKEHRKALRPRYDRKPAALAKHAARMRAYRARLTKAEKAEANRKARRRYHWRQIERRKIRYIALGILKGEANGSLEADPRLRGPVRGVEPWAGEVAP